jgi:hypothetical protein
MEPNRNINFLVLKILSPILILIGVAGYFLPSSYKIICTDSYYNLFHIDAGIIGFIIVLIGNLAIARLYNILLGCVYVYQAVASFLHIFPAKLFHYTVTDDILNIDIGAVLILIGLLANNVLSQKDNSNS